MNTTPKLSFIVLSYNYADLIGQTIRSILDQTIQSFEIIVTDDASKDESCAVVRSFDDSRIKLLVNESNLGGAASYNRAISAATGEYLVNLDADDWIRPDKCEKQLAFLERENVEVLGTYASFVDRDGRPAANAAALEEHVNRPRDLNELDAWIGHNRLVRSSTMVKRAAHQAIGMDDPSMTRAPDYELWTRFLRAGCRFAVLPEPLVFYRVNAGGVTHADPRMTFLEMSYAACRNLIPLIADYGLWPSLAQLMNVWLGAEAFAALLPAQRYRLLGMLAKHGQFADFAAFRTEILAPPTKGEQLDDVGRSFLAIATGYHDQAAHDIAALSEARDYWHTQTQNWESEYHKVAKARDFWHTTSNTWEAEAQVLCEERAGWQHNGEQLEAEVKAAELRATAAETSLFTLGGARQFYRGLARRIGR